MAANYIENNLSVHPNSFCLSPLSGMANSSTHHVVSTTKMWNWRLNFSTQECQMSCNSSNNQIQQHHYRKIDDCTSYILSSGELSSSSNESQKKKRKEEKRRKKKERKQIKEERRRKRERGRKGSTNRHGEDCINLPIAASKRVKHNNVYERVGRSAISGSKSNDSVTWVASKATTTSISDTWIATSNLNSQNNEIIGNASYLYEAVSSDEDSLLDFTPKSDFNLISSSDAIPESEVAVSVKQLSREELEKVAIRHIAICKKFTQAELELDLCKGREENFHSMILQLNQEVIKLRTMIPLSKTTRSIGVQVESNSPPEQQNSSSTPYPIPINVKMEGVKDGRDKEFITSNDKSSNHLYTSPSSFDGSVVLTPTFPVSNSKMISKHTELSFVKLH